MTDLQAQTDQLLKAFNALHNELAGIQITDIIVAVLLFAVLLVVAFRKR